jgi:VIT family protein
MPWLPTRAMSWGFPRCRASYAGRIDVRCIIFCGRGDALLMVVVSPAGALVPIVSGASLGFLALLGALGASAGGANIVRTTARVTFWGALAMALTAGIGKLVGAVV